MKKGRTALAIMMAVCLAAAAALADTGTVHGGWLLLREAPSTDGRILSSYPSGTVVTLNYQTGSWYAVTTPDGMQGYMMAKYLYVSGSGSGSSTLPANSTGYVTSSNGLNVRMRSGPGLTYSVLAAYAPGTTCTVLGIENGWYRIQIGSYSGYMMKKFVTGTKPGGSGGTPSWLPEADAWVTSDNGRSVNLRSGAGTGYASLGLYAVGTGVKVLQRGTMWTYIQIGSQTGYMMSRYLTTVKPGGSSTVPVTPSYPASGAYVVSANGRNVNLRTAPSTQVDAIAAFPPGTPLTIITQGITWDYVQIQGLYGYMMRVYINSNGTTPANTSNAM